MSTPNRDSGDSNERALTQDELKELIRGVRANDLRAVQRFYPLLLDECRAVAAAVSRDNRHTQMIQTTVLLNEGVLQLGHRIQAGKVPESAQLDDLRRLAKKVMLHHLVDQLRRSDADKRTPPGGHLVPLGTPAADDVAMEDTPVCREYLKAALEQIKETDERAYQVIVLRYIEGVTIAETAQRLGISEGTVKNDTDWGLARLREILDEDL